MKKIKDESLHPFTIHVSDSFDVYEEKVRTEGEKAGESYETLVGYFTSLPQALNVIIKEKSKRCHPEKEIVTLAEYHTDFKMIASEIKSAFETQL